MDIRAREFTVTLSNDREHFIPYMPSRSLRTVITVGEGDRVEIKYVSGASSYWYANVYGSYPLSEPQEVCACSPGVHKTRQLTHVRFGYPDSRYRGVPAWLFHEVKAYAPEWFNF